MKDHLGRPVVAITGAGLVTSLGAGREAVFAALLAGRSGVRAITRFPTEGLRTTIAGTVDFLFDGAPPSAPALSEALAALAVEEALVQSGAGGVGDFPGPLFIALPPVEMEWPQRRELALAALRAGWEGPVTYDALIAAARTGRFGALHETFLFRTVADRVQDRFGTRGSPVALSTACSSGATAIQLGAEAIRRGEARAALCVGTDGSVHPESLVRFSLLSALSTRNDPPQAASRPFAKDRDGFVMGEGAGALVLEDFDAARARGARVLGVLEGVGERGDGFHRTRSSPSGAPIIRAMELALADAGVGPEAVDHVNAHGTGTPENDKMESMGLTAVLGERAGLVPVTSNKSMVGHTLTAAGAVEAVVSLLTILHGRVPPTINRAEADPAIPLDVVTAARDAPVTRVLSNSFGFGGQNTCLVIAAEPR